MNENIIYILSRRWIRSKQINIVSDIGRYSRYVSNNIGVSRYYHTYNIILFLNVITFGTTGK